MSLVDYFLNSLIKQLQKTQKARDKKRKTRRASAKKSRKLVKLGSSRKKSTGVKRKGVSRKEKPVKRPVKKSAKKSPRVKKKKAVSKSIVPKKIKKTVAKIPKDKKASNEVCIGEITHFFSRIQVVVLKMTSGSLSVGDNIHIKGRGVDFSQKVGSLQIESNDVKIARKGALVGLKVNKVVKVGSKVYK
ncbi:MAG: hypothetical protein KAR32_09270 [Candidatus Omnitrophica bacterium]|nr:hypothetical protein [Candidatus Omnitrophota bacterium]